MKTTTWRVAAASVLAAGVVGAATYDDELPEKFDASTGYVTLTTSDSASAKRTAYAFRTNNVDGTVQTGEKGVTGKWSEEAAQPHSGTNYYVALKKTLCSDNSAGGPFTFAGDQLVIDGTLQGMSTDPNVPTIEKLFMLGGAKFTWTGSKKPYYGNCYIRRSSSSPVLFTTKITNISFGMDVDGKADQHIVFLNTLNDGEPVTGKYTMTGNWANYYGSIFVTNSCFMSGVSGGKTTLSMKGPDVPAHVTVTSNCVFMSSTPTMNLGGLTVGTLCSFGIAAGGVWKVGDLALANTMTVAFGSDASQLVVTNSLTRAAGATFVLSLPEMEAGVAAAAADLPLIVFEPEVDLGTLSTDDFTVTGVSSARTDLPHYSLSLDRDDTTGRTTLYLHRKAVVVTTSSAPGSTPSGTNFWFDATNASGAAFWSDGGVARAGIDYLYNADASSDKFSIPDTGNAMIEGSTITNAYVFPGDSLTLVKGGGDGDALMLQQMKGNSLPAIDFKRLVIATNVALRTYSGSMPTLDGVNTLRILGSVVILPQRTLTSTPYSSKCLRFDADMSGSGGIELSSYRNADKEVTNQGKTEFLNLNTNFTGRISFNHEYYTKKASGEVVYTIPNDRIYCTLYARDGRNLGGPLASFDYDSLWLRHWGLLRPRNSLTLDQANRGVYVSDVGQMMLTNGVTLTIANPLTLAGKLILRNDATTDSAQLLGGTLALGGPLRFAANDTLADVGTPTADENVIVASNVCVQALATNSFDGAALTLFGKAAIVVDPLATGDMAAYGLVNTRENGTILADDGDDTTATDPINVRVVPSQNLTAQTYTVAICTVPTTTALTTNSFAVTHVPGYAATVTSETTAVGTTFRLTLERRGLAVMFR